MTCSICGSGLANSAEGKVAHYKKYHAVIVKRDYVKMDPLEKIRIRTAFEHKHRHAIFGYEGLNRVV